MINRQLVLVISLGIAFVFAAGVAGTVEVAKKAVYGRLR